MLRLMMCVTMCVTVALAMAGCRKAAEKTTEKVVKYTKETGGGISEGYDKGRKDSAGIDGTVIITAYPEIAPCGKIDIYGLYPSRAGKMTVVVLAVQNNQAAPMELADLHKLGNFTLLDGEGFAYPLDANLSPASFTVQPNAKQKLVLYFDGDESKAKTFRLYGQDVPIPAEAVHNEPCADDRTQ